MVAELELVIVGAGGHGRVCAEVAIAAGYRVAAFCDPAFDSGSLVNGITVNGYEEITDIANAFSPAHYVLFIAIGGNGPRLSLLNDALAAGFEVPALVHPSAVISSTAKIGAGSVVCANGVVNANSIVGKGCILNTACSVDHDNFLGDGVQICPGVRAAGDVRFGEGAFIGTGAILVPGVSVGRNATIMAGALVIGDVGEGERIGRFPSRPNRA